MPCGKRPLVKTWDKSRHIRVITPSRYEQNEASVKVHWHNVIKELELSYKDEQFWESNCDTVRNLVGPTIFQRIAKIFELPEDEHEYVPLEESSHIVPSEQYYIAKVTDNAQPDFSTCQFEDGEKEDVVKEEESEDWTVTTIGDDNGSVDKKLKPQNSSMLTVSKSISKIVSKSFSRFISRVMSKAYIEESKSQLLSELMAIEDDSEADSYDDLNVHRGTIYGDKRRRRGGNPYFDMLYCNKSETDMIKWKSHYKQKTFEVSASDEFSKRAEIMTKKISKDFYDWWVGLGNVEFKSEIKRPEDIEDLFQVWFEEHASRGIVLDPKIIPCVIRSIAKNTGIQKASCLKALKRQIKFDIEAETNPAHTMAFGSSLPHKLKHVPPQNNTGKLWSGVKIPDDLRSMSCVWEDIQHLTSTKAFQQWLVQHPSLAMPPFLKKLHAPTGDKKSPFVVPSDFVLKDKGPATTAGSVQELALPVSQFSLELKEVLSKLMNEQ